MDMGEGRGTTTAPTTEVLEGLNDLLQLDHDAIGSYEIAIERLEDQDHASQISGFKLDHERHIRQLNDAILELGGTPRNEPHATAPLKQAMQRLGAAAGDRGTLIAWRANELQVRAKYDGYASRALTWPDRIKRIIDEAALDEERHYDWVANALQQMGVGAGEGVETDLLNKLRERGNVAAHRRDQATERVREQVSETADRVRNRVGEAMGTARMRAAEGLDRAGDRLDRLVEEPGSDGRQRIAGAAGSGLHGTADFLRSPDVERLRTDAEAMIRERPASTLLGVFVAGFVIGRLLR